MTVLLRDTLVGLQGCLFVYADRGRVEKAAPVGDYTGGTAGVPDEA